MALFELLSGRCRLSFSLANRGILRLAGCAVLALACAATDARAAAPKMDACLVVRQMAHKYPAAADVKSAALPDGVQMALASDWLETAHIRNMLDALEALGRGAQPPADPAMKRAAAKSQLAMADWNAKYAFLRLTWPGSLHDKLYAAAMGVASAKDDPQGSGKGDPLGPAQVEMLDALLTANTFDLPSDEFDAATADAEIFDCAKQLLGAWYGRERYRQAVAVDASLQAAGRSSYTGFAALLDDYWENALPPVVAEPPIEERDVTVSKDMEILRTAYKLDSSKIAGIVHGLVTKSAK